MRWDTLRTHHPSSPPISQHYNQHYHQDTLQTASLDMAANNTPKRSPLTAATIPPPSLNRQTSHNAQADLTRVSSSTDATTVLANVVSRKTSPQRCSSKSAQSSANSSPAPESRRVSWEECMQKAEAVDGYVSFPDFDQLKAEQRNRGMR